MFKKIDVLINNKIKKMKFLQENIKRSEEKLKILNDELKEALNKQDLELYTEVTIKINSVSNFILELNKQIEEFEKVPAFTKKELLEVKKDLKAKHDPVFKKFEDKIFKLSDEVYKVYQEWEEYYTKACNDEKKLNTKAMLIKENIDMTRGEYAYNYDNIFEYDVISDLHEIVSNFKGFREIHK